MQIKESLSLSLSFLKVVEELYPFVRLRPVIYCNRLDECSIQVFAIILIPFHEMITQLFIYNESTISNKLNSTRFLKANEILSIEKFFDSSKYYFLLKKKKKTRKRSFDGIIFQF